MLGDLIPAIDEAEKAGRGPLLKYSRQYVEGPEVIQPYQTKQGAYCQELLRKEVLYHEEASLVNIFPIVQDQGRGTGNTLFQFWDRSLFLWAGEWSLVVNSQVASNSQVTGA